MSEKKRKIEPIKITVGMLKGGVGRTTAAVHIAVRVAELTGERVLLVDADPNNKSSWNWSERAGDKWPELVTVVDWAASNGLAKRVSDSGFVHVVIDTGNDARLLRQSLRATDILLIPCGSTENDELRIKPTMDEASEVLETMPEDYELNCVVLLSKMRAGTNSRKEIREALDLLSIPVLDAEIPLTEHYGQALGTVPTGTQENVFTAVVDELIERTQGND